MSHAASAAPRPDEGSVEVLLPHVRPVASEPRRDLLPVLRTALYTLDISSRFLLRTLTGTASIAAADQLLDGYWRRIFSSGNAELRVTGRSRFAPGQAYVLMSNHSSLLDIPALMGAVPTSMRMVMKEELRRVPIWGRALVASGFVPIDRKNREKAIGQLEKAKELLAQGVSIWISPEGTRSKDGRLAPFKKGGFHLALDLGVPIMPIWIDGATSMLPPRKLVARYDTTCTVRFGRPIPTQGRGKDTLAQVMTEVREAIVSLSGQPDPVVGQVGSPSDR